MPNSKKTAPKKVHVMDTTLRDAHQSLLATRMKTEDLLPIAEVMDSIGFWSVEVWGGATFDTCLRFLREDPWERLRTLKKAFKKTPLQMLLRGQNVVGYRHYADDVVEKFVEKAVENGMNVFRIFDALNDFRNIKSSVKATIKYGGKVEASLCYTLGHIYNNDVFTDMAKKLEDMGADTICIKDMAGLLAPRHAQGQGGGRGHRGLRRVAHGRRHEPAAPRNHHPHPQRHAAGHGARPQARGPGDGAFQERAQKIQRVRERVHD